MTFEINLSRFTELFQSLSFMHYFCAYLVVSYLLGFFKVRSLVKEEVKNPTKNGPPMEIWTIAYFLSFPLWMPLWILYASLTYPNVKSDVK